MALSRREKDSLPHLLPRGYNNYNYTLLFPPFFLRDYYMYKEYAQTVSFQVKSYRRHTGVYLPLRLKN